MLYTLFAFTRSSMIEICTLEAQTLDDAARAIDCRIESWGHDRLPVYRPHLIGAKQCASLTTGALTKEELLRLAATERNRRALVLLRNPEFRPLRLHIGNVPREASHYHGNDRLVADLDCASERTYFADIPDTMTDTYVSQDISTSDFRVFGHVHGQQRNGRKKRHRGGGRANNGHRKGPRSAGR